MNDKSVVTCRRIACNHCAPDEYEVVIKPLGKPEQVVYTLAGVFERDESICDRAYSQWLRDNKK